MRKTALFLLVLTCAWALTAQEKKQQKDPWAGTWKLDLAKSKFHGSAPKEETIKIDVADATAVKFTVTGTTVDGKNFTETYSGKPDSPGPLMRDGQEIGKVTYHRISATKSSAEGQMGDGATFTEDITLAPNGKSFTIKAHVKSAQGEYDQTAVFSR